MRLAVEDERAGIAGKGVQVGFKGLGGKVRVGAFSDGRARRNLESFR